MLNVKTYSFWLFNFFSLILLPASWVYILVSQTDWANEKIDWILSEGPPHFYDYIWFLPFALISLMYMMLPLFYFFIVAFYGIETGNPLSFLSLRFLKAMVYLNNTELFYKKLFDVFEEMFASGTHQNQSIRYEVSSQHGRILIKFDDEVLKTKLCFFLEQNGFYIKRCKKEEPSCWISLEEHDRGLYQKYFDLLSDHATGIENKRKEKEAVMLKKQQEKEALKKEKQVLRDEELFEKLFSTIVLMKKRGITYLELLINDDSYNIQLKKQNVLVSKNENDVYIKCDRVAGESVVYLQNHSNESEYHEKVLRFYTNFITKTDLVH